MRKNSKSNWAIVIFFCASLLTACGGGGGSSGASRANDGVSGASDLDKSISMASSAFIRLLADPVRPYVYVSDKAQNSVHLFNTDTYEVELSIAVGSDPTIMDIKADGSLLFVVLSGGSQIAVVDLVTQSLLTNVNVPGAPNHLVVDANDLLYVSIDGFNPISIFDVSTLPAVAAGTLVKGGFTNPISGRSYDRTRLYTHSLTQWDITSATPVEIQSANIAADFLITTLSPDDTILAISPNLDLTSVFGGASFPNYDGDVPFYRASDLLKAGTINVEWTAIAVGISPTSDTALVAHNDSLTNATTLASQRHNRDSKDLHIFELPTFVQTGSYSFQKYVKRDGIEYGPDGRIYLLLGDSRTSPGEITGGLITAKTIGVIIP